MLKPGGSIWVNLGDKYATRWPSRSEGVGLHNGRGRDSRGGRNETGSPEKSLLLLPERYRIACVDRLGLIARAVVIWSKPNGLPESVTDRVRRSHEDWVHLVKQPRYFAAVDAIREAYLGQDGGRGRPYAGRSDSARSTMRVEAPNPLGKLPGSVREVATRPLTIPAELGIDHFAAFPMEWPRWIISGWSPSGICLACGEGRRPLVARPAGASWHSHEADDRSGQRQDGAARNRDYRARVAAGSHATVVGETCGCPTSSSSTRPAVVLDPFGGTGTTALVADTLGRRGVSVDMSADYCRLAAWRTTDPGQRAAAMQVEKPPAQLESQLDLFALPDPRGVA